jgi:DNA primase
MSKEAIVVEGYLDVIALYKAGVKNIVSASGTTFTDKQIKILKKYTNKIILCFDGDDAGEKATERMIEPVIKNEINCSVVRLPLNEDPDSFVNKLGKESFLEYIKNNEVDIIDFFVKINLKKADSEKEVLDKLLETLSPLEETTTLFFILKKISKKFEIPLSTITKSFRLFKSSNNYANTTENNNENNTVDSNLVAINDSNNISVMDVKIKDLEKEILLIFLEYPDFLDINIIYLFKNEEIKKVLNLLLEFNYTKTFINKETFLDSLASELSLKQVNYLKLSKPRFLVDLNEEMVKSILNDYLRKLDIFRNKKYIEEIKKEIINVNDFFNELDEDDINKLKKNKRNDISEITQKIKEIKNLNYL